MIISIRVTSEKERKTFGLLSTPYRVVGKREPGDNLKIVYIKNPRYGQTADKEPKYIALLPDEYEVVEETK